MKKLLLLLLAFCSVAVAAAGQQLVRYELNITDTVVNYTGKTRPAIAVNGMIPMPTLYFTEGDTAEVVVTNHMHHETSIHWHGLLLPNEQDGVPYLTTAPILPHDTHTFRFVIRQHGTYWYHSHTMLQEQVGMYGAIVIYPRDRKPERDAVLLLSDWSDMDPDQIERGLHFATDWFMIRKNAVQSYGEALVAGQLGTKLENEWKRMHAMDVSDVYYERFLVNGRSDASYPDVRKGEKLRLRVINGSSSSYFWLQYGGGKFRVVATDGVDVEPVEIDRLIVGVSESYDVEITIPDDGRSYGFTATAEDRTGSVTAWFGQGEHVAPTKLPVLDYFAGMRMMNDMMTTGGNLHDMGMNMSLQKMDMNNVMYRERYDTLVTLHYGMLRSPVKTLLPDAPITEYRFELTGNMNRYVWTVNNRVISEHDKILIRSGQNVRIVITNNSMMRHPMHLHGHFFRVLNGQGDYSPLKNVIDIMPMETDTIEFNASEGYGDWYFHCHILYHMMAGMGRIFSYDQSPPNPQIPDPVRALRKVYADDRRFYLGAEVGLETNGSDGEVQYMNTRWRFSTEWRLGFNRESGRETESHFGRFIDNKQFLFAYAGWDWRDRETHAERNVFDRVSTKNDRSVVHAGLQYVLPWFIVVDLSLDHTGYFRAQVRRDDLALTRKIRLWGFWNTDREYSLGARYIVDRLWSLSAHYDSDMGPGMGLTFTY